MGLRKRLLGKRLKGLNKLLSSKCLGNRINQPIVGQAVLRGSKCKGSRPVIKLLAPICYQNVI
jgi:hypothetical protein